MFRDKCLLALSLSASFLAASSGYVQAQVPPATDNKSLASQQNGGFVVLNSGIANMAAQKFGLPNDARTYPLAGITIFPYYKASAPLQTFLDNAKIGALPITAIQGQTNIPQISLPQTDLVRRSISIPNAPLQRKGAVKMTVVDKKAKDEVPWMVAHQGGQAFQVPGDTEAIALVAPGSMFSACASRTMVLRSGVMWILTGSRPVGVLTKNGAVAVKPMSIAAVQATWLNDLHVVPLYGSSVETQIAYGGKTEKLVVDQGHEILVSESMSPPTPVTDKSDRSNEQPAGASESTGSIPVVSESVDMQSPTVLSSAVPGLKVLSADLVPRKSDLLKDLALINPPFTNQQMTVAFNRMLASYGITQAMRRAELQRQLLQKSNIASKSAVSKLGSYPPAETAGMRPAVPLRSSVSHESVINEEMKSLRLSKGRARTFVSSDISIDGTGKPYFHSGEAVFIAKEPLVIKTSTFSVHMRPGSAVHMVSKKDLILVRNISEEQADSVKIRLGDHIFDCGIGGELAAGVSAPIIFDEMRLDGIGRRNMQSTEAISGSVIINKSEISLSSLMKQSPLLKKMYKSPDSGDKELIAALMKTTVALEYVAGGHGQYRKMAGMPGVH